MTSCVLGRFPVSLVQRGCLLQLCVSVLICIFSTTLGQQLSTKHEEFRDEVYMRRKLLRDGLIPEIVDGPPKHAPEFIFLPGSMADYGNKVAPEHVVEAPRIVRFVGEPNELFTLIMTDFDAPSRATPDGREFLHWAMGNCGADNPLEGDTIAPFFPINPKKASGIHRYVFYVFKQANNERVNFQEKFTNRSQKGRKKFNTKDFAHQYKLGNIYGINYFLSEWVPEEDREPFIDPGADFVPSSNT